MSLSLWTAGSRGKNRAIVAVAHSITVASHHMLTNQGPFQDLEADFFDKMNRDGLQNHFVKGFQTLEFEVQFQEIDRENAT